MIAAHNTNRTAWKVLDVMTFPKVVLQKSGPAHGRVSAFRYRPVTFRRWRSGRAIEPLRLHPVNNFDDIENRAETKNSWGRDGERCPNRRSQGKQNRAQRCAYTTRRSIAPLRPRFYPAEFSGPFAHTAHGYRSGWPDRCGKNTRGR